jgi:hypothetical protein
MKFFLVKRLPVRRKAVPLHPQSRNDGFSDEVKALKEKALRVLNLEKKSSLKDL